MASAGRGHGRTWHKHWRGRRTCARQSPRAEWHPRSRAESCTCPAPLPRPVRMAGRCRRTSGWHVASAQHTALPCAMLPIIGHRCALRCAWARHAPPTRRRDTPPPPPPRGDDQHGCASLPERRRRPRRCHASRIATGWYLACVPRRHGEASRARSRTKFMHTGPARARAGTGCRLAAYFARNPNGIREYRASWAPVV